MSTGLVVGIVLGSYLLGSVSFSYLIVKIKEDMDVRTVGSGNAGATNVMRAAGKKAAALALLLDIAKGITAVIVARAVGATPPVVGGAAVAVVLGHVFPVFFGFRGGKGVATSAGALGALAPTALFLSLIVFVLLVYWKRYVSLGSLMAATSFPVLAWAGQRMGWVEGPDPSLILASAAIALLVVVKHRSNLERLRQGTEPRLGERKAEA
jgi:acyl phosphate:glycerol-3-phosphate acyltransferase